MGINRGPGSGAGGHMDRFVSPEESERLAEIERGRQEDRDVEARSHPLGFEGPSGDAYKPMEHGPRAGKKDASDD